MSRGRGRPEPLFPLFADLETLPGVGPKSAKLLDALHIAQPVDLLMTLPQSGIDRRRRETLLGADLPGRGCALYSRPLQAARYA